MIKYVLLNILETLLRFLPVPSRTGLIKIGNPDRDAPVFLTCNYHLTVERVKKALKGMDCYLLVANSKGINVWCAAAGGFLSNHAVISVLKTSSIEDCVDHRKVILPQLAAAGVEAKEIKKKTGWNVVWGPVYAKDIHEFMKSEKTPKMREVTFDVQQRMEMGAAWAFPVSVILALVTGVFWREAVLFVTGVVWGLSLGMNVLFPVYGSWLKKKVFITEFGKGGIQLVVWAVVMVSLFVYNSVAEVPGGLVRWSIISLVIVSILGLDLMGNTPVYKSGLHEERLLSIVLDKDKCKGAGYCEQVCPRTCFTVGSGTATVNGECCIQCGACIVQCPFDAVYFKGPKGVLRPEVIRKYKVNLMGRRSVKE